MSTDQNRRIAYDFAFQYAKEHRMFSDVKSNIPKMVDDFAEVCELFSKALISNEKMQKLF